MIDAYIILGSNVSPEEHLQKALQEIADFSCSKLVATSSFYRSPFLGREDLPDVINIALYLKTTLEPEVLLSQLLTLEQNHGREREEHVKTLRTLDCDILLYGDAVIELPHLTIPHPEMTKRDFVLVPLLEIAPTLKMPNQEPIQGFLEKLKQIQVERMHSNCMI